jgi:ppGpp synthetase/RelA/SpoT-type nucleotidyltranferase
MNGGMSKTRIDALGERLRKGALTDADLRQLDAWRRSFADAYQSVMSMFDMLGLAATGRPAKSTSAIVAKLKRETIRLSQMQDIAGCRVVVESVDHQDRLTDLFREIGKTVIIDRRLNPSHGYRAVHVIVEARDRFVEIQIRTLLQHIWAEFSEKLSDMRGSDIKYGIGDPRDLHYLQIWSHVIECHENGEEIPPEVAQLAGPDFMNLIQSVTSPSFDNNGC